MSVGRSFLGDSRDYVYGWLDVRAHAISARDILLSIDVDFTEGEAAGLGLASGELLENGRDLLAGTAPVRVEVDDEVGRAGEGCLEVRRAGDGDHFGHCWCCEVSLIVVP